MTKYILPFLFTFSLFAATPQITVQVDTNSVLAKPRGIRINDAHTVHATNLSGGVLGRGVTTTLPLSNIVTAKFKDVAMFGLTGDGVTDFTSTLQTAIDNDVNAGETIAFLSGTNILDALTIDKSISIYVAPQAVIKWKDNGTTNMIQFNTDWSGEIYGGGTFDGGTQTTNQYAYGLVAFRGNGSATTLSFGKIHNVRFKNFTRGVNNIASRAVNLSVRDCVFEEGMQVATNDTFVTAALWMSSALANSRHTLVAFDNIFTNSARVSRLPGGIFISGDEAGDSVTTYNIQGNKLYNVGDDHTVGAAHYGVAAIDIYNYTKDGIVQNNLIDGTYFTAIKAQNTRRATIKDNKILNAHGNVGIEFASGERTATEVSGETVISGNTIHGNGTSTYGIRLTPGALGSAIPNIIIENNITTNCYRGINIDGFKDNGSLVNSIGPIKIYNNILHSTNNNTIQIYGAVNGSVDIVGNTILNQGAGSGISIIQTNNTLNLRLKDNDITGAGWAARIWGVRSLHVDNNTFSGGAEATEFKQDAAGNLITNFVWTASNRTLVGTNDHVLADFTTANIRREDGKNIVLRSGTSDEAWLMTDGVTPILTINSGDGLVGIGPTGSTIAGTPLTVRYDTNALATVISARNLTSDGAVGISVRSELISGGIYSWDDTYVTPRRTNRISLTANNGAGLLIEATTTDSTLEGYIGETGRTYTITSNYFLMDGYHLIREITPPSSVANGFGALYFKSDGKPYVKNDSNVEHLLLPYQYTGYALGDMTTTITNGTSKAYWIAPEDGYLVSLDASVFTVSSSGGLQFDINVAGSSALSTKLFIDEGERSSLTSNTNYVFSSSTNFNAGDLITFDIDVEGTSAAGPQLKFKWAAQ